MRDPKIGMRDPKTGMREPKIGIRYSKIGMRDPKTGMSDAKTGMSDPKIGIRDSKLLHSPCVGPACPRPRVLGDQTHKGIGVWGGQGVGIQVVEVGFPQWRGLGHSGVAQGVALEVTPLLWEN